MFTNNNLWVDFEVQSTMKPEIFQTGDHKGVFSLFGCSKHGTRICAALGIGLISGALLAGCGNDQPRTQDRTQDDPSYYTDQSRAVFAPESDPAPAGARPGDDRPVWELGGAAAEPGVSGGEQRPIGGWSIVLTKLGTSGMKRAQELLRVIQDDAGLRDAFIEQRSEGLVIAYGNYMGREAAEKDLARVRNTDLLGTRPFEGAIVTPPASGELRGSNPAFDLRTVKERYGKQAVYTLQVGLYGRADYQTPKAEDLAQFRIAAEDAVRDLRAKGEMAFYYHAPARSMVTIGVFGEKDFDSTTRPPYQSPALKAVRDRFPNNLLNGQGINETIRTESGRVTRMQSSQLVAIPEN